MIKYLVTLWYSTDIYSKTFTTFKKWALKYLVQNSELFWCKSKNMNIQWVVNDSDSQKKIIKNLHDQTEHKSVESTYWYISMLYWWDELYTQVKKYCQTCEDCQWWSKTLHNDTVFSTYTSVLFKKVSVNMVKMSICQDQKYIVVVWEDLSEWVEIRVLTQTTSAAVAKFLWENIITQHDVFNKLICNEDSENKLWIKNLTNLYRIAHIVVLTYNSDTNRMVEHEHKSLIDGLAKMTTEDLRKWTDLLSLILWTDRTMIHRSTDWTLYELLYDYSCILSIEAHILTWSTLNWKSVQIWADLLTIWAEQLLCQDIDLEETAVHIEWIRQQDKNWTDSAWNVKNQSYKIENLVLLYNSWYKKDNTADWKLNYWWLSLYKIVKTNLKKKNYVLAKLDRTQKSETVLRSRLKLYLERHEETAQDYEQ